MKKIIYLLLVITLITIKANAQEYNKPDLTRGIHPGTVTTLDGQVLKGYIFNGDYSENQSKCIFYTDYNDRNTEKTYKPADLLAYSIENNQYKSVSYSGNIGFGKANRNFLFVAQQGAVITLVYWAPEQQLVWQKGDDEPISNSSMLFGFRKSVLKLVGDDKELADKVQNKEKGYGITSISQIIDEYNTWAQAKKQ